jgi:hypothetical protein
MLFATTIKRPIGKSISVDMLTQVEVNAAPLIILCSSAAAVGSCRYCQSLAWLAAV